MTDQKQLCVSAIRVVSAEAIQKANSGHPGIVLGAAPMAFELFSGHLRHDPACPDWPNRDRFILSAGHGSMLLYSLLHLFGYGLTMEDLKSFRQLDSLTPGHPEYGHTVGVEATTGPLGQGVSMAVGMAMAEAHLAAVFNRDGFDLVDHYTYALVGDGCMMEGISSEAASLAGTQQLHKLIVLYDRNRISIEGNTATSFNEDVPARYRAYGWQVIEVADGENMDAIGQAIQAAKESKERPTLIVVDTKIGAKSPLEGSEKTHGEPLGADNIKALKEALDYYPDREFYIPQEAYGYVETALADSRAARSSWDALLAQYKKALPDMGNLWDTYHTQNPAQLVDVEAVAAKLTATATRSSSGQVLNAIAPMVPQLMGGSADLAPSNKTVLEGEGYFSPADRAGRNIHFGVREHAMAAIANGMALHGGVVPYVATFLVFSDYLRHSVRLSALMHQRVLYILTHDSIGVGEDGPTHQPIEHIASFRAMPGVSVFRPADGKETAAAYLYGLGHNGPTLMALSRQNLPLYEGSSIEAAQKGGYVIYGPGNTPDAILIATGSEVDIAIQAAKALEEKGKAVRVVSMPSMDVFEEQDATYKESVLPSTVRARVVVEVGTTFGWHKYAGDAGEIIGIDRFGASAPGDKLFEVFGFTVDHLVEALNRVMAK
ncbi:transketolase [Christensenella sp. MSJ-20]|uniref:transketolase n=1 Tax=Christensenella sp. MSJ-20 TaxID=2841518 RepID=UPI001C76BB9A|nr:transketolase [Christensenella sp. MSJ-20]